MTGDLYIYGSEAWNDYSTATEKDAWDYYGMNFEDGALATLLTPPAMKEFAEASSRLSHGSILIVDDDVAKFDSREVSIQFHLVYKEDAGCLTAEDTAEVDGETYQERTHRILMLQYKALCDILAGGKVVLKSRWSDDIYRMVYNSCSQMSLIIGGIMKFTLKLTEPNPNNRGNDDNEIEI